ncbi:hypothetical protein DL96DRAFT_1618358 [Flagelloscypha sp. PMI_526]|nr:hypothetical protein DL96DRAFT_1618358 [Flagelloscypha sp. PMI_526]
MHALLFPSPPLSTSECHLLTLLFASLYVGSIYISKHTRLSLKERTSLLGLDEETAEKTRDHPAVIKARLFAVSFATVLSVGVVFLLLWKEVGLSQRNSFLPALYTTIQRLGLKESSKWSSIGAHLVTPILFLGPLYASHYLERTLPFQKNWSYHWHFKQTFASLVGLRNYIVAPITEEIVFRACILSVYQLSGASKKKMIFLSPLSFGLAHVHHAYETYVRLGRTNEALQRATLMSVFQLAYTTLFGFHCALSLPTDRIDISVYFFAHLLQHYGIAPTTIFVEQIPSPPSWWVHCLTFYTFLTPQANFVSPAVIVALYLVGIAGYIFTMKHWTLNPLSLYWKDQMNAPGAATY